MADETIAELIEKKRAADGYDPEFEAFLARQWECPSCGHRCTILQVLIPVGSSKDFICPSCLQEGIGIMKAPSLRAVVGGAK